MSEVLNDVFAEDVEAVSFASKFVNSGAFTTLFREGMGLVEEAASYLDGAGREESRSLPRLGALAYATESMRLTTRLMQLASWLLVQRAVAEGEITSEQALNERNRVRFSTQESANSPETIALLPESLKELIAHSLRLQERVRHLDNLIQARTVVETPLIKNPIASQMDLLRTAFQR
jgi:regulator of CtrA degradation